MINSVILVGRLTADPELRYLPSGTPVVSYTLAVQNPFRKDNNGKPTADFINVVTYGQQAENLAKYKKKGNLIGIEGMLRTRRWEDKRGKKHSITEVVTNRVSFLVYDNNNQEQPATEEIPNMASDQDDLPF